MRLATYEAPSAVTRAGLILAGRVHPVASLLGSEPLGDVGALLDLGPGALDRLRDADPDPRSGEDRRAVRLRPPLLRPPSIRDHIAFEEHANRSGTRVLPDVWRRRPLYYYSGTARLFGHDELIPAPVSERLDYELELAAVIGTETGDAPEADAMDAIVGFTLFNDWSARDIQADEMAYGLGPSKGKDFGSSFGPWLVTTDELRPHLVDGRLDLACAVRVNGETWVESGSREMFHSWPSMVAHASYDSLLLVGDLLGSGTVGGCSIGEALRSGRPGVRYLMPGDRVELVVDHIGVLTNTVGPRSAGRPPAGFVPPSLPPMPTHVTP